ncbi:hypothetical protein [Streptosporangium longisporum]|uniref:Uncharacterized protein n=1 Tax=Streptosporangium longisporum TaxID=46187 RepID=A0ABP6KAA9_9ACTN
MGGRLGAPFPFDTAWILIRPRRILTWGVDGDFFETGDFFGTSARDVT